MGPPISWATDHVHRRHCHVMIVLCTLSCAWSKEQILRYELCRCQWSHPMDKHCNKTYYSYKQLKRSQCSTNSPATCKHVDIKTTLVFCVSPHVLLCLVICEALCFDYVSPCPTTCLTNFVCIMLYWAEPRLTISGPVCCDHLGL